MWGYHKMMGWAAAGGYVPRLDGGDSPTPAPLKGGIP